MDELGPWQRAAWTARLAALAARQGRASYRSATVLQGEADRRAVRMIVHAYETVPYYRETMRRLGLRPGDLRTVGELQRLPVIEPQDLQRDPEYFMSTAQPPDRAWF